MQSTSEQVKDSQEINMNIVQCGNCRYFQQNDINGADGQCFKLNELIGKKTSWDGCLSFLKEQLGGVSFYPDLNRVCYQFSARYGFEISEHDDD